VSDIGEWGVGLGGLLTGKFEIGKLYSLSGGLRMKRLFLWRFQALGTLPGSDVSECLSIMSWYTVANWLLCFFGRLFSKSIFANIEMSSPLSA